MNFSFDVLEKAERHNNKLITSKIYLFISVAILVFAATADIAIDLVKVSQFLGMFFILFFFPHLFRQFE